MKPKRKWIRSIKASDTNILKKILDHAGISATDEQIKKLYTIFCDVCGTEYFYNVILSPVFGEIIKQEINDVPLIDNIKEFDRFNKGD